MSDDLTGILNRMSHGHYVLVGQTPVIEPDLLTWGRWYETADRRVALETVFPGEQVSTIFLGLDHAFGGGPPILFESMVRGGEFDGEQRRCSTWMGAEAMHKSLVAWLRDQHENPGHPTTEITGNNGETD